MLLVVRLLNDCEVLGLYLVFNICRRSCLLLGLSNSSFGSLESGTGEIYIRKLIDVRRDGEMLRLISFLFCDRARINSLVGVDELAD